MKESSNLDNRTKAIATWHERVPELKLPIEPGFASKPVRLSPDAMCQWCEQMMAMDPAYRDDPAARLATKCSVEFVL